MPDNCFNPIIRKCMLDIPVDAVIRAAKRVIVGNWLDSVPAGVAIGHDCRRAVVSG